MKTFLSCMYIVFFSSLALYQTHSASAESLHTQSNDSPCTSLSYEMEGAFVDQLLNDAVIISDAVMISDEFSLGEFNNSMAIILDELLQSSNVCLSFYELEVVKGGLGNNSSQGRRRAGYFDWLLIRKRKKPATPPPPPPKDTPIVVDEMIVIRGQLN